MQRKEYPTYEVATGYGMVTMTFLSPRLEQTEYHYSDKGRVKEDCGPLAAISGTIKVNGVGCKLSFKLHYQQHFDYHTDQPTELKFNTVSGTIYNRREDSKEWDYDAGYAKKVRELTNTLFRHAYENNLELAAEAEKVYLWNVAAALEAKLTEAKKTVSQLEEQYAKALAKIEK